MTDIDGSATPARKRDSEGCRMSGNCDDALSFGVTKHSMGRATAALKITYKDPAQLKPRARTPRTHTAKQIKQIAASIKEFGFISPILTDGADGIIAGHGRAEAAKLIGMNDVPTVRVDHLTPAQIRAYVIADNRLAENAGWDRELLALELHVLSVELNFDVTVTGFETAEADLLISELNEGTPDEADDVVSYAISSGG